VVAEAEVFGPVPAKVQIGFDQGPGFSGGPGAGYDRGKKYNEANLAFLHYDLLKLITRQCSKAYDRTSIVCVISCFQNK